LIYPAVLVVMVIGLFIFLITFVVPRFAELYEQLGTKLPAITTFLLDLGKYAQSYGIYVGGGAGLMGFLLYRWVKTDSGAALVDKVRIGLPLIGNGVAEVSGGAVLADALDAAEGRPAAGAFAGDGGALDRQQTDQQRGHAAWRRCARARGSRSSLEETKIFPELAIEMIEVGESTGALPQMLNSVAEFFEEDVQTNLTAAMSLIEPIILIVMGVVVVTILISLYLPIFQMGAGAGAGGGM
jgi:type IV pilus assembly protein PilC